MLNRQALSREATAAPAIRLHDKPMLGQMVGDNIWELSVSGDPAEGLAAHFDACELDFMVMHGLGGLASRRFVGDLAKGRGVALERLVIRREGAGTALASLCYADLRTSNGRYVRVYSTDVASEHGATKITIKSLLLSRARTAVALLGEMPAHQMEDALIAMGRTVSQGGHRHRTLVIQPAYDAVHTDASLIGMIQHSEVTVRRAVAVRQPADAWPFLSGTWLMDRAASESGGRSHASPYDEGIAYEPVHLSPPPVAREPVPEDFGQVQVPMPVQVSVPVQPDPASGQPLDALAQAVMRGRGQGVCCVFNVRSLAVQAQAGSSDMEMAQLARQGRLLLAAIQTGSQPLQVGKGVKEASIRFAGHVVLLRELTGQPELWVMAQLPATTDAEAAACAQALVAAVARHAPVR
ncbi:MAG TPA: hypothetical protein VFW84_10435 [Aquabacterium sp.]|uniref:hypothetical protein n=1 Tax=Aquabacterium sp. TaxID=1872578 RepID=UPI002E37B761|nr:hypothetical protein [Aquabacterium sp.]HEX5373140.1 hypothetical protein [Aquabacterium sp.]